MLDYILNASKDKDCVIIYMTDHGISQRRIHIYKLTDTTVKAYCYLRKSMRTFKKDAILSAAPVRG
jgi:predicted DNA-binding transcriptional regulator YafY